MKKIMFVEDDKAYLYLLERASRKVDTISKVEKALNGKEALDRINFLLDSKEELPNLILLDINMPIMNGFEFLEKFKELREVHTILKSIIPIAMLSSSQHEDEKNKALETGIVQKYIVKPLENKELVEILRNLSQ